MKMKIEDLKRLNESKYADLNYLQKSEYNLAVSICYVLLKVIVSIFNFKKGTRKLGDIHIIALTVNNVKSVKGIISHLPVNSYSIWKDKKSDIPNLIVYLKSFLYIHLLVKLYKASSKDERMIIRHYCLDFFRTCALYKEIENIFMENPQLKMVVFPNDHYLESRCFIELAAKFDVKTLYVQHASVNETFPPLHFTYAFLDGQQSFMTYQSIGDLRAEVFLTGSPRFDDLYNFNRISPVYDVGIALNSLDSQKRALELCLFLKEHYSEKIVIRPHTGMIKEFNFSKFENNGIAISDPTKELSFEFLSKTKHLIANESGIHLDAAQMRVPSTLYNFSDRRVMDWYSFVKNKLIRICYSFEDILDFLSTEVKIPIESIRYYDASYESPYEGKVGEFIADFIKSDLYISTNDSHNYLLTKMRKGDYFYEYLY